MPRLPAGAGLAVAAVLTSSLQPAPGPLAAGLGLTCALALVAAALGAGAGLRQSWPTWLAALATAGSLERLVPDLGGLLLPAVAVAVGVVLPTRVLVPLLLVVLGQELVAGLLTETLVPHRLLLLPIVAAAAALLARGDRQARRRLTDDLAELQEVGTGSTGRTESPDEPDVSSEDPSPDSGTTASPGRRAAPPAPVDLSEVLDEAGLLELVRRALRAESCVLWERRLEPPGYSIAGHATVAEEFDALVTAPLGHGLIAWAAKHDGPFRISNPGPQLRQLPKTSRYFEPASFLALPLVDPGAPTADQELGAPALLCVDSPLPRAFGDEAPELLGLHATELLARRALGRELARLRHEQRAFEGLEPAGERLIIAEGLPATASALLAAARDLGGATAGAVLWDDRRLPASVEGLEGEAASAERAGPVLLATAGLDLPEGHRLLPEEESWARWSGRNPEQTVSLPAHGPDRGLPRVARGDGLDASYSFVGLPLGAVAGESAPGALALAWTERRPPSPAVLSALAVLGELGGAVMEREEVRLRLDAARRIDGLTGLPTRTSFLERGGDAVDDARRDGSRLSLAIFDLDRAGRLAQEQGPAVLDDVLEALGRLLLSALPGHAELHRTGADELAALLPGASREGVLVAARRACAAVAQGTLATRRVTVSAGVATLEPGESWEQLLARGEEALQLARGFGQGKVVDAPRPERD
ncbi:MAG: sensor domain-containing diguanylate cyclase [Acidobacteriota bacterium]